MNTEEYRALSHRLRTMEDVKRIAQEEILDEEFLLVIYTQRETRGATKNYYRIKAKIPRLLREWEQGKPLILLARRNQFPPVLMAYLIMMERKVGRKTFWKYVREPDTIPNKRLRREIMEVVKKDHIYSPRGSDVQAERGRKGEARGAKLLDKFNVSYLTEKELRGQSSKTPDFLLHKPLIIDGRLVNWIESKANFGDLVEVRRNTKKQLLPYTKLFGPGLVVYWFGYVSDAPREEDIMMVDGEFMEEVFSKENWGKRVLFKEGGESPVDTIGKVPCEPEAVHVQKKEEPPAPPRPARGRRRYYRPRGRRRGSRGRGRPKKKGDRPPSG